MKKILLYSSVALGIFTLCQFSNISSFQSQAKEHRPNTSGKINKNIYTVKAGISNFYIVTNTIDYICIDAGSNLKKAKQELHKLNINPEKIQILLLTHSDQDHTTALSLFKNAQIYLSIDEEEMVLNKKRRLFGFINNKLPNNYYILNDGCEINIGDIKVRAIATPGHTSGSTSYLVNNHMLFTGDTLSLKNGKAALFTPSFFNMDEKTQEKSIKKLALLENIAFLCTAHHGYTDKFKFAMKEWRNELEN